MKVIITEQCWKDANLLSSSDLLRHFLATKDEENFLLQFQRLTPPLLIKRFATRLRIISYEVVDAIILARILDRGSKAYQIVLENPLNYPLSNETRIPSLTQRMEQIETDLKGMSDRLKILCNRAKSYHLSDPESALNQARKTAELICRELYDSSRLGDSGKLSTKCSLSELIQQLHRNEIISRTIYIHLCTVRDYGNFGSHDQGTESLLITPDFARPGLEAQACLVKWYITQRASHN